MSARSTALMMFPDPGRLTSGASMLASMSPSVFFQPNLLSLVKRRYIGVVGELMEKGLALFGRSHSRKITTQPVDAGCGTPSGVNVAHHPGTLM